LLSDGFCVAGMVLWVKHISVSNSWQRRQARPEGGAMMGGDRQMGAFSPEEPRLRYRRGVMERPLLFLHSSPRAL
jgi:hypothetical protein